ncbi:MAG: hypothetical protein ACT4OO_00775 [Nitrospiraceae bacterium]
MRIDVQIAGYTIRLEEAADQACLSWPLSPFESFTTPSSVAPDIHFDVRIVKELSPCRLGSLRFDACHGLWKLFESDTGLILESADTRTLQPRLRAYLTTDFSLAEVLACEQQTDGITGWVPMHVINPLMEICLVTKLARQGGILLHGSGILVSGHGTIFTGPSGAGKSTLSAFFATQQATVLSDERVILRKMGETVVVHGTPWVGTGCYAKNESGPLTRLYCIRHGRDRHRLDPMLPGDVFRFLLRQCYLPHWDRDALDMTLRFLSLLIQRVDCAGLAFVKDPDIVEYLSRHPPSPSFALS